MTSVLISMLALTTASGAQWSDSFDPAAVSSYLDSRGVAVLVAAAGDPASSARPAAKALANALRASGKTSLVADDGALGDLSGLSDSDIVAKAHLGTASVAIVVRVFPGAEGQPPTAVVTLYSINSGKNLSAFTVERGSSVPARIAESAVPTAAMESVSEVAQQSVPTNSDRDMEDRGIWSQDQTQVSVNSYGGTSVSRWTVFFRGKHGPELEGADLYDYMGRHDLAGAYRSRSNTRLGLLLGGLSGSILGVGVATASIFVPGLCTTKNSFTLQCTANAEPNVPVLVGGVVVTAVGLVVMMSGLFVNPNPVSIEETNRMVDDFNDTIRKGAVGGGSSEATPGPSPFMAAHDEGPPPPPFQVGAFALHNGGGLTLALQL